VVQLSNKDLHIAFNYEHSSAGCCFLQ